MRKGPKSWSYVRLLASRPQELLLASLHTLRLNHTGSTFLKLQAVGPVDSLGCLSFDAEMGFLE